MTEIVHFVNASNRLPVLIYILLKQLISISNIDYFVLTSWCWQNEFKVLMYLEIKIKSLVITNIKQTNIHTFEKQHKIFCIDLIDKVDALYMCTYFKATCIYCVT